MSITDKQQSFIRSLLKDRNPDEHTRREAEAIIADGDRREASGIIDRLLNAPRVERPEINGERLEPIEVAPGRYALPSDYDPEGTPVFYKVDHGKAGGRWEGFVFLSKLIGPNESRVRDRDERNRILTLIAQDTMGALRRYGHLAGCCGNCGLELTDKFSRFIGVGPVCREKLGLAKSEAAFVADGGQLPAEYHREVAAEEEAATPPAPVVVNDRKPEPERYIVALRGRLHGATLGVDAINSGQAIAIAEARFRDDYDEEVVESAIEASAFVELAQ